jgi:ketosteroid isomerase-like protein
MKILLSVAATTFAITALAGCSGDDDGDTATDPASKSPTTSEPTDPPTVGTYPEFEAANYTYLLEQQCYCPVTGPVKVTVEDGEVTSAVITTGGHGMKKGSDAPEYLQLTINEVIARANDTDAAEITVDWPDGQEWPNTVAVDQVANAVDDEVTYVIRGVEVS